MNALQANRVQEVAARLRGMINDAEKVGDLRVACEKIALILDSTLGVWLAADYTYKGREIAKYARETLRAKILESKPILDKGKYARVDQELASIVMRYHAAEQERLTYGRAE